MLYPTLYYPKDRVRWRKDEWRKHRPGGDTAVVVITTIVVLVTAAAVSLIVALAYSIILKIQDR